MAHNSCNPFDLPGHYWRSRKNNLRPVTEWMCEKAPRLSISSKICDTSRKKISKQIPPRHLNPFSLSLLPHHLTVTCANICGRVRPFMDLELFLATITVDHFPFSHCFAQKLDSEEDSGGIRCDKTCSTKVEEDCGRTVGSVSSTPKSWVIH